MKWVQILEGIKQSKNVNIQSLQDVHDFLEVELNEIKFENQKHKKVDFFARKMKDSKEIVSIGFKSLNPVILGIENAYEVDNMSESLQKDDGIFYPLFYGTNRTNGQYKKIQVNTAPDVSKLEINTHSFSDFLVSAKFSSKNENKNFNENCHLRTPVRLEITNQFLDLVEKDNIGRVRGGLTSEVTYYVDFESIYKVGNEKEQNDILASLLDEYPLSLNRLESSEDFRRKTNAYLYMLENIYFQATEFFELTLDKQTITQLFDEEVELNFEVPTEKKKLLAKDRIVEKKKKDDSVKSSFLEMFLLQEMVVMVNVQSEFGGYVFKFKKGGDEISSLSKEAQIYSDAQGNKKIGAFLVKDVRIREKIDEDFKKAMMHHRNEVVENRKETYILKGKLKSIYENFLKIAGGKSQKEKRFEELFKKEEFEKIGRHVENEVFQKIDKLIITEKKKEMTYYDFLDIVIVLNTLLNKNKTVGKVDFMTIELKTEDLVNKPTLKDEELCFLAGELAAMAIIHSKNKNSLKRSFYGVSSFEDYFTKLNKRIASSSGEKENNYMPRLMEKVTAEIVEKNKKEKWKPEQKFAYLAGFLKRLSTLEYKQNVEENSND